MKSNETQRNTIVTKTACLCALLALGDILRNINPYIQVPSLAPKKGMSNWTSFFVRKNAETHVTRTNLLNLGSRLNSGFRDFFFSQTCLWVLFWVLLFVLSLINKWNEKKGCRINI